ncbi:MAG: M23 family metallopeptidase [Muribaculaceae bacterium]|nr:M23 family metallopeptidase [Muribaculaceae bacterium]
MRFFSVIAFLGCAVLVQGQNKSAYMVKPVNIPAVLAGNFGELRPNHFHGGVDFKTQGRTGWDVHSADDGYISRISVSPWGYGRAVYVTHPATGLMTVYGHLEAFTPAVDKVVKARQYELRQFAVDMEFPPEQFPVKRGEVIAVSGNAGHSFGPHVHFEVRETETGYALDPIPFMRDIFNDKVAPEVRHLGLYPHGDEGVINGEIKGAVLTAAEAQKGFTAWGKVIPAINAFDKMTGTANIYGVKYLTFSVDGKTIYERVIDRYDMEETRAVNTLAFYGDVVNRGRWMMWTYVPPSQPLGFMIKTGNNGILDITEERPYKCEFTLTDEFGNTRHVPFTIRGKRQDIVPVEHAAWRLDYRGYNYYNVDGVKVEIPSGVLYDDIWFNVSTTSSENYISPIVKIGDPTVPLANDITVEIPVTETVSDPSKLCLVRIGGSSRSAIGAEFTGSSMKADVNRFGTYAVTTDATAPTVRPLNPQQWGRNNRVAVKISDNLSGVETYSGEIDGRFVLMELDGKSGTLTYDLNAGRVKRGGDHKLTVTVTDGCGNRTVFNQNFRW